MPDPSERFTDTYPEMTVAQCLLKYLEIEGIATLFGVPGGANLYVLKELMTQRGRFDFVISRQETGAAYIADGYSRVTGQLGVVLVTSGPGATNALTGAVCAESSNSSVLVISGEVPEKDYGKGYLQEGIDSKLDVDDVYDNAVEYSAVISNPDNFQTLFTQALRVALARPRRTAHVSIPQDIAGMPMGPVTMPVKSEHYRASPRCSSRGEAGEALDALLAADFPLIFLGGGCRSALAETKRLERFTRFVDRFALPVMTTPGAKALFPETDQFALRTFGLAGCQWPSYYLQPSRVDPKLPARYDALLVLASNLGDLATGRWQEPLTPARSLIQVDMDQVAIARSYPVQRGIVAEIGHFLDDLIASGEGATPEPCSVEARRAFVKRLKQEHSPFRDPEKRGSRSAPILPQALMKGINDHLPPGSHLFIDAGNCVGWALHYLELDPPTQVHSALAMGPMGFGVGSVIGGKLGAPDRTCVAVVGDGAFLMHGSEVSTAAQYNVGAVWVVLFDNNLNMVSQGMNHYFPDPGVWRGYYPIGNPDLKKFAEALGAEAYRVEGPDDFEAYFPLAVKRADAERKPQVIVAHINRDEVPPYYEPAPRGGGSGTG